MIQQALLSVSNKTGIVEFARALAARGIALLSTGGTAQYLARAGIPVTGIADYTGFPEILDGRIKTLHPKVHGALLARRDSDAHCRTLEEHGIGRIDLLAVNLYPFTQTIAQADCTLENALEQIDIGGPAMLRAAAKNYRDVTVVTDPDDYETLLAEIRANGNAVSSQTRFRLAAKAFAHTAQYDGAITNYLTCLDEAPPHASCCAYPAILNLSFEKVQDLRYGENPHQQAAFYRDLNMPAGALSTYRQWQGKALSYNNLADADAAWECVKTLNACACVIVKHANPCGAALAESPAEAFAKALQTDPAAAFGGIIAFNREMNADAARALASHFVEVLIAPAFSDEARQWLAAKQHLRALEIPLAGVDSQSQAVDLKRVGGGLLVQSFDTCQAQPDEWRVVTKRHPGPQEMDDLRFVWQIAKFVKSNAVVFGARGMTYGIGAGQMSRLDAARIAGGKAQYTGSKETGFAVASDAFFPFRDGLDVVAAAGARCVIQPGGSIRDDEIIAAADEHQIAMVFTGVRHFRH
ncbi:Phosphoribosylaminoimidazolecarboxamide formyltransferase (AICAR transformylase) [Candidatus Glomeribacter gigasporarum BEG34]|uniref:Bifunctional purine biosynthesis protein PurH n=1 Tax=Candidatus Glomeribacter gigasporarum BEG34 TaxID=1070319 RepID=G2JAA0_9BURK|nr:bifunctional phosphoribosylaminoimidazolecarboxamide formyltransferase/IMP cyclohydrolase [Candidatus Glomeribacter gigasporarum]CCD29701.1 Phosphoribosylaminoimidazolecarboxamide formyltransferase (AICAR transformylase) [Candidatus Glomeribacter gigasporarum BEG34]